MLFTAALAGCGSGGGSGSSVASPTPAAAAQVFALTNPGDNAVELVRLASLAAVDGLAFRVFWSGLEPAEGSYDWTSLDAAADAVRSQGKTMTIHINPLDAGLPSWLSTSGATIYTYIPPAGPSSSAPLPWDSVYLSSYGTFVASLANHISTRGDASLVKYVSVPVPVPEMSLSVCGDGVINTTSVSDPAIIYDRTLYLNAWKTSVGSQISAFASPQFSGLKFLVSAPARDICHYTAIGGGDSDGSAFYSELMTYALQNLSSNMAVFAADLNAGATQPSGGILGSLRLAQALDPALAALPINLQTISSATSDPARMDGALLQAICNGRAAGGRNFEIYKDDLDNPAADIQSAIAAARNGQGC